MQERPSDGLCRFPIRSIVDADTAGIMELLRQLAPEIPINLSTPERVDKIIADIEGRYRSPLSLVATDGDGAVIGFCLAEQSMEADALHLGYVGVTRACRRSGVFPRLLEITKAHRQPILAEVVDRNTSDMVARLTHHGFSLVGRNNWGHSVFLWSP